MTAEKVAEKKPSLKSRSEALQTVGFGASGEFFAHEFKVYINAGEVDGQNQVTIVEDFGFLGNQKLSQSFEVRARMSYEVWRKISDVSRKDFNARLKAKGCTPSTWKSGENKMDRLLGRELCVLAWAAEHASKDELSTIIKNWSELRTEERWWLYSLTAASARMAEQRDSKKRKALHLILSDDSEVVKQAGLFD